jgi:hypothetical protein
VRPPRCHSKVLGKIALLEVNLFALERSDITPGEKDDIFEDDD